MPRHAFVRDCLSGRTIIRKWRFFSSPALLLVVAAAAAALGVSLSLSHSLTHSHVCVYVVDTVESIVKIGLTRCFRIYICHRDYRLAGPIRHEYRSSVSCCFASSNRIEFKSLTKRREDKSLPPFLLVFFCTFQYFCSQCPSLRLRLPWRFRRTRNCQIYRRRVEIACHPSPSLCCCIDSRPRREGIGGESFCLWCFCSLLSCLFSFCCRSGFRLPSTPLFAIVESIESFRECSLVLLCDNWETT